MSKVLNRIKAQIKIYGELPEHMEVLKLYNFMVNNNLSSTMLWNELTNAKFVNGTFVYSVKPQVLKLLKTWNK